MACIQKSKVKLSEALHAVTEIATAVSSDPGAVSHCQRDPKVSSFISGLTELYLTVLRIEAAHYTNLFCVVGKGSEVKSNPNLNPNPNPNPN